MMNPLPYALALFLTSAACNGEASNDSALDGSISDATTPQFDAQIGASRKLTVNDVSVLFPLPGVDSDTLWRASLETKDGPILSRAQFAAIGMSLFREIEDADEYDALRIVSLRYDKCFGEAIIGGDCVSHVRLVLQGYDTENSTFVDGAIHLTYAIAANDIAATEQAVRETARWAPENHQALPLGPSPALAAQGMQGPYAEALRALLHEMGSARLSRMTFMTREPARADTWKFGGFDFSPDATPMHLASLASSPLIQNVVRGPAGLSSYGYALTPNETSHGALLSVLDGDGAQAASDTQRTQGYDALLSLENPELTNSETDDCASCHVAERIRSYFDTHYAPDSNAPSRYRLQSRAMRVQPTTPRTNENLRAFGYFQSQPTISQRTANETIDVLRALGDLEP